MFFFASTVHFFSICGQNSQRQLLLPHSNIRKILKLSYKAKVSHIYRVIQLYAFNPSIHEKTINFRSNSNCSLIHSFSNSIIESLRPTSEYGRTNRFGIEQQPLAQAVYPSSAEFPGICFPRLSLVCNTTLREYLNVKLREYLSHS